MDNFIQKSRNMILRKEAKEQKYKKEAVQRKLEAKASIEQ